MTKHWTPLAVLWVVLSVVGLIGSAYLNGLSIAVGRDVVADWFAGGPAVLSLAVDLIVVAVACCVFIVVEARRMGMRFAWVLVPLSAITAIAFTFPLFLALRERALEAARSEAVEQRSLDL